MSTQTGSIDLKGLKKAYNDAVDSSSQYVWNTESDTGAGAGLHITNIPEEEFLVDPENGGFNALMQSIAQVFRDGLVPRAIFGAEEITLMTPDGAEAFKVAANAGATSVESFTIYVGERITASQTYTFDNITSLPDGEEVTVILYAIGLNGATKITATFNTGTSYSETFTGSGYSVTVAYNSTSDSITITSNSGAAVNFDSYTYTKSTPTPEISIRNLILSNGFRYLESRFVAWENNSPTSSFTARTVSLNGYEGEFDAVEIYYRHNTTDDRVYCVTGDVGTKVPLNVQGMENNRTGGRIATVNSNGIAFGAASYNTNSNNAYAIPIKVVGVKHV